jgi:hypothetical protein
MLLRLKIPVYDIVIRPPKVLKGSLDYDLHILIYTIGLDYLLILFLYRRAKALLYPFTPPPFHKTLITLVY